MAKILVSTLPVAGHVNPARAAAEKLIAAGHTLVFALPTGQTKLVGPSLVCKPTTTDEFSYEPTNLRSLRARDIQKIEDNIKYVLADWTLCELSSLRTISESYDPDLIISDCLHPAPLIVAHERHVPSAVLGVTPYRNPLRGSAPLGSGFEPASRRVGIATYTFLNCAIRTRFRDATAYLKSRLLEASPVLKPVLEDDAPEVFGICHKLGSAYFQCSSPSLEDNPDLLQECGVEFIGPMNLPNLSLSHNANAHAPPTHTRIKARVVITWGTMQRALPEHFAAIVRELSEGAGLDIVLAPPDAQRSYVNLKFKHEILSGRVAMTHSSNDFVNVLRTADVLVSNGGFGAVKLAVSLGVPVVCFGDQDDKPDVCGRVRRSGVGIGFSWRISRRRIVDSIRLVLREAKFKKRARVVGQELCQYDSSGRLEAAVERLLRDEAPVADVR